MAANFFEQQDQARRNTKKLILYFILSIIGIITSVYLVVLGAFYASGQHQLLMDAEIIRRKPLSDLLWQPEVLIIASASTIFIIAIGSLYKIWQLQGGGQYVAESLGGRKINQSTDDLSEQRLLNVVQEMSIASGVPAPPVYLMDNEDGINAFAAGYTPDDAVIGVTRGAAERLSREELQGVIAHEFSHILNGDMKLNIRLMGFIHGILVLGIIGYVILRASFWGHHSSSSKKGGKGKMALLLIGLGLFIIGYVGTFFANLIKAAVNRQREYLADSAAVQFTRNPDGLAGALATIGGFSKSSEVEHDHADEASHMFFENAIFGFRSLFSTHPPLKDRIQKIKPDWEGEFDDADTDKLDEETMKNELSAAGEAAVSGLASGGGAPTASSGTSGQSGPQPSKPQQGGISLNVDQVGQPGKEHVDYARKLLDDLPEAILNSTRDPYDARSLTFALLIHQNDQSHEEQLQILNQEFNESVVRQVQKHLERLDHISSRERIPLIELALPELRSLTGDQTKSFLSALQKLIKADQKLELFEWCLYRILKHALLSPGEKKTKDQVQYNSVQELEEECQQLLSTLAHAGNEPEAKKMAFEQGMNKLSFSSSLLDAQNSGISELAESLDELQLLSHGEKKSVIEACIACIKGDDQITLPEAELLRAISSILDCPMPPVIPDRD